MLSKCSGGVCSFLQARFSRKSRIFLKQEDCVVAMVSLRSICRSIDAVFQYTRTWFSKLSGSLESALTVCTSAQKLPYCTDGVCFPSKSLPLLPSYNHCGPCDYCSTLKETHFVLKSLTRYNYIRKRHYSNLIYEFMLTLPFEM